MSNVVLIGFMACGKTTIGTQLSKRLNYRLLDTDELIVKRQGRSINDIFANEGEPYFRKLESDVITELAGKSDNCIISTGGGLPITKGNDELLKKLGKVVYLTVTKETVLKRIQGDTSRPLLAGDAKEKTTKLLEFRHPIYENAADVMIKTDDKSVSDIVEEIISTLNLRSI